ncbi:hypothetical protein BJV82DRAFT_609413 [Fennellomyces sp. T-0311]|nr:hypothetical protein BJV82DRAFT_609413 [Fennellomyces sp. T-0311]
MDPTLVPLFILFQLIFFTFIYRHLAKPFPEIRLATALVFFVSTAHVIMRDFIGLGWFPTVIQAITAWILLFHFIKRINGSKAWVRTHLREYKGVIAVLIVQQFVDSIFLSSAARRENANHERLTITLHVIHLAAFAVLVLRSPRRLPSAAFFVYNFIVILEPLGTTLKLFTEFPARILYCGEYYNCRENQLKLQYFLFSAFALIEILPAIILCLDGVCTESKLPKLSQADDRPTNYGTTPTQEEEA